jgi:DNA-binding response OmpR family regulator
VLAIDDDAATRGVVVRLLGGAGMHVLEAGDGRAGLRLLHERRPDLVILDVGLPELDGFEVLQRIRDVSSVPVLMLTGRGDHHDKVRGLDSGADDYVPKPFDGGELAARVGALLRRANREPSAVTTRFTDGAIDVDLEHRSVTVDGEQVQLTPLEFRLLAALVRHAGQVLAPEQLLEQAWDDPTGMAAERVKFAVMRLRRKLEDAGAGTAPPPIETVRGFGYRYRAG